MSEKNKKKITISIITVLLVVFTIGITYAFVNQVLTGTKEVVINAGVLDLVLEEENAITIANALPMYDEVGMIQEDVFVFRLVNKTSNPTNYVLKLQEIETGTLDKSIVKYGLIKEGEKRIDFVSNIDDEVIDEGTINGNETIDYELRLWIDSEVTNLTQVESKFLSFRIITSASQEIEKIKTVIAGKTFEIEESNSTFPNFTQISSETNGRGIYKYTEDGEDIYYWRGKVDEVEGAGNHVIFGGYCWEMVRTTKTGGIKIIYDGTPVEVDGKKTCQNTGAASALSVGNIKFNVGWSDNAYVGYMYGLTGLSEELNSPQCVKLNSAGTQAEIVSKSTKEECIASGGKWATTAYHSAHANVVNSNIKGVIDTWFSTSSLNTEENLEKIEDTVYCNDRSLDTTSSGTGYGKSVTDYGANYRLYDKKTPSLECANKNDRFTIREENGNGDLTYPVGLLTADEIALAGGVYNTANSDYYLYTGGYYWSLSPYSFNNYVAFRFDVRSDGCLGGYNVSGVRGVRPVISLAAGTTFKSGTTGTESNPYVVE